jgi:hypothetical protein
MPITNPLLRDDRWLNAMSAVILAALTAAVAVGKPGHAAWLPPCPLHAFTGFVCPGCGSTRALYYLVHGQPLAAFRENALAVILLPLVIFELGALLSRRWPSFSTRFRPWTLWGLLAVVIVFGVLRNLPWFPLLAPTNIP